MVVISKFLESINSLRIVLFTCLFFANLINTIMAFSTVSKFKAAFPDGQFFSSLSLRRTMIYLEICSFLGSLITIIVYLILATLSSQKFDWAKVDSKREEALQTDAKTIKDVAKSLSKRLPEFDQDVLYIVGG